MHRHLGAHSSRKMMTLAAISRLTLFLTLLLTLGIFTTEGNKKRIITINNIFVERHSAVRLIFTIQAH